MILITLQEALISVLSGGEPGTLEDALVAEAATIDALGDDATTSVEDALNTALTETGLSLSSTSTVVSDAAAAANALVITANALVDSNNELTNLVEATEMS